MFTPPKQYPRDILRDKPYNKRVRNVKSACPKKFRQKRFGKKPRFFIRTVRRRMRPPAITTTAKAFNISLKRFLYKYTRSDFGLSGSNEKRKPIHCLLRRAHKARIPFPYTDVKNGGIFYN